MYLGYSISRSVYVYTDLVKVIQYYKHTTTPYKSFKEIIDKKVKYHHHNIKFM